MSKKFRMLLLTKNRSYLIDKRWLMMTTSLLTMPRLPAEVIEGIINRAILADIPQRILSYYALVSRRWRHRTNATRFRHVRVELEQDGLSPNDNVQKLAQLMTSDILAQDEGIAQHVRRLTVYVDPTSSIPGKPHNASIVSILESIVRGQQSSVVADMTAGYELIVTTKSWTRRSLTTVPANAVKALVNLCRNIHLTVLDISHLEDVPISLLFTSTLRQIHINNVVNFLPLVEPDGPNDGFSEGLTQSLKIIILNNCPTFTHDCNLAGTYLSPSTLVVFKNASRVFDYEDVYSLGSNLKKLSLHIFHGELFSPATI